MSKDILNNLKLPEDVLDFLKEVDDLTKGYDIYLGGGCVRDLYYNELKRKEHYEAYKYDDYNLFITPLTPKDIDLFFVPNGLHVQELPTIPRSYVNYDKSAEEISDMEERGVARVRGLFVPKLDISDVQFIVYKDFMSQQQLAKDMDIGLNQVMMSVKTGEMFATEDFYKGHEDEYIEMLHTFDFVRMAKRVARMKAKFPDYDVEGDWNLIDLVDSMDVHAGSFCDE